MTRHPALLLLAALAIADPASAQTPAAPAAPPARAAGAPSASPFEGVFFLGGAATGTDGNTDRAGEYAVLEEGLARLGFQTWGERNGTRFDVLAAHSGDARDQRYRADLDVRGRLRASVNYNRLPHRLDHDPLTWMNAISNVGGGPFIVRNTDTDPAARYAITYGDLDARAEYAVPVATAGSVTLFIGHRRQARDGYHQSLTTSHCFDCHTSSYTRQIEERTNDTVLGAALQLTTVSVGYEYQDRAMEERSDSLLNQYDRAKQPQTLQDVFLGRVSYDERFGALPFDQRPGADKTTHTVRARVGLPGRSSLTGLYTASQRANTLTGLGVDFSGGSGRFVAPLGKRATFRAAVRSYDIQSDRVFVDVNEPITPAGPEAGKTYAEAQPTLGVVDYLRESALSRQPTTAEAELVYRPFKKTSVRLGYLWESITRDHVEVEKTVTNTLNVSARGTPTRAVTWQARVRYDAVTDPFAHVDGAIPAVLQPFMSPGNVPFTGLQYFDMYRARQADLTMFPTSRLLLEGTTTWMPDPHLSLTAHYRYRGAGNDDLDYSTWDQSMHTPGLTFWAAPNDRVSLSAGYQYQRQETDTVLSTLAFSG